MSAAAWGQGAPAPSQVEPPKIALPVPAGHISIPQVPAGAAVPAEAKRLTFTLTGFDIDGEFPELAAKRKAISGGMVGRRVTVAEIFEFADRLQQIYVRAGYPLVRVVILPQELEGSARIKLRVIDGFVERLDLDALGPQVHDRVRAVLASLVDRTHLTQSELERRLLIAGDTAGLTLNATFSAGKKEGGSLLILTGDYRPVSLSLYADNAMPGVFGHDQIVSTASLNSVLGLGEQITVSAAGLPSRDFGSDDPTRRYLSAKVAVPIGTDGWTLEFGGTDGVTTPRVSADAATQGTLKQVYGKLSYDLVKLRNLDLAVFGQIEATDEEIDTLQFTPAIPLSLDRVRPVRFGVEGTWRMPVSGTTIAFASTFSHGLDALGARMAADATPLVPLSRQGADADFNKWDGRVQIVQALPQDFSVTAILAGQTSFNRPLLRSEQFDIDGSRALSGFTSGSLSGDTAWVARAELARAFAVPVGKDPLTLSPYVFAATGERTYVAPTALEVRNLRASEYGMGLRISMAGGYGFAEWSHRTTDDHSLDGDGIFTGLALQY
ncbi:MAG: ShlB/FhaC/HecB family hemolysin secretion/activation protein [Mesorhizobium sp.]|nr:ShlB/FhaC/HecB family hemolysin secretion/activation protein [Mesorhizobium sp.]MBN9245303.1 ShlB/FhaC/HecB family hemolysin secretion/activation protein [Mesorhizobium sp.]